MNNPVAFTVLWHAFSVVGRAALLPALLLTELNQPAYAGSATWNLDPVNSDWSNAANWTPNTVPNDPSDIATFGVSNLPLPKLSEAIELGEIVFKADASAYAIKFRGAPTLDFYGTGVTNNSAIQQTFNLRPFRGVSPQIVFHNSASAGENVLYRVESPNPPVGLLFLDDSTAGGSMILNGSSSSQNLDAAEIEFSDNSTAGDAFIVNSGGTVNGAEGAVTNFTGSATAGNATIIAQSSGAINAGPGKINFQSGTHAGNSTLIGQYLGGASTLAELYFYQGYTADQAR